MQPPLCRGMDEYVVTGYPRSEPDLRNFHHHQQMHHPGMVPFNGHSNASAHMMHDIQANYIQSLERTFQQNFSLLEKLHERSELVGRVHTAVMRTCTYKGMVVDLIVYDRSGQGKLPGEPEDVTLYQDLVEDPFPDGSPEKSYRYVIKATTIPWFALPSSISSLPAHLKIQSTLQFVPPFSTFKVYCSKYEPISQHLILKMANRSSPVIQLPPYIKKELSFSKEIQPNSAANTSNRNRPRFLVIFDFEATCDFSPDPVVTVDNSEIIEFPWVVLDTTTLNIVYERRIYIRPSLMEGITNYCKHLTGITAEDCEEGMTLEEAIAEFEAFLHERIFPYGENNFRIVTDSVWDLQVQLRLEAQRKQIPLAWWFNEYFDLRDEFRHFYAWFNFLKRGPPLHVMLRAFNLDFVGRHHSGLDDCMTIAQIVKVLLQIHPKTFSIPKSVPADYNPHEDPSWCSFMGVCPPDAWKCSNEECNVWNKPQIMTCRFCKSPRS